MAKKHNPEGEKVLRKLPFKLDDSDKAKKGMLAAEVSMQIDEAKAKMASANAKIKEAIKTKTAQVNALLREIREGVERREVQCVEIKNFEKSEIEWHFEGKILESRDMVAADRQIAMKIVPEKPRKGRRIRPGEAGFGEDQSDERAQIAEVHRIETSRKGATTAVDPKHT